MKETITLLRGDLDWIVMKCLEKDRTRRYETANGLARDVERYLADEPVEACPPGAGYRLRKFVKRNKGRVVAAGLVLVALLAGMAGTTWGMIRAEQARQDAVSAQFAEAERAEGERRAKEEAQTRLAQIEKGTEILASVFRDLDPMAAEKEGVTLRDLLGRRLGEAAQQLEGEAVGDPLVVARLQHVLGISLRELGHLEQAEGVLVKACRTRERLLGADHLDTVATKHHLAVLYRDQGKYALAETLFKEVLAVRTAKLGADHLDTVATKHHLAVLYRSQRKYALAETLFQEVLAVRTARLGADDLDTLATKHNLAVLYRRPGEVRPGRGAVQGGAGGPHRQAGGRPPRHPHQPAPPGRAVPVPGEVRPGRDAAQGGAGGPHRQAGGRPPRHPAHPERPGRAVLRPGEVRPGRDAVQGGAGGPDRQAGGRPPRHPLQPVRPGHRCTAP